MSLKFDRARVLSSALSFGLGFAITFGALMCFGCDAGSARGDDDGFSNGGTPGAGGVPNGSGGSAGSDANAGSGGTTTGMLPAPAVNTPNLFASMLGKSQAEVDQKVTTAVNRFFGVGTGEPSTPTGSSGYRCYYELPQDPNLAFIWAADSNDVRSEGMSYGMMIAVQMGMQSQFDKLWAFAKRYMQYPADSPTTAWKYYFRWQGKVTTSSASSWSVDFGAQVVPAPDGDEYFAAALYLADQRWGSAGAVNYKVEADHIADAMLHNVASTDGRYPLIHTTKNMVVFVPYGNSNGFTDPSYHLPGFYELFALYGPAEDAARWKELANVSRAFLVSSAHPTTGLHPDYATFDGAPTTAQSGDGHDCFQYDAWRVVMNMAVDYAWFSADSKLKAQVEKYHSFFETRLGTNDVTNSLFAVDGSSASGGGSTALTATLAAGSIASSSESRAKFVSNLWNIQQQQGTYRYYQEGVYLLALLATSGNYRYAW